MNHLSKETERDKSKAQKLAQLLYPIQPGLFLPGHAPLSWQRQQLTDKGECAWELTFLCN